MQDPVQLAQLARAAAQRGDWPQAELLMRQAVALAPQAAALHLNYGNILKQLARYSDAHIAYEQALYWQPGWADAHYNLGNLAVLQNDAVAAAEHYRATLDAHPDHIEAHYNLASVLTNLGQFAPAHTHFAAALKLKPKHADAEHNLGRLYRREGDLAAARAHYVAALAINPEHALARYSLGTLDLYEARFDTGWQGYEYRWSALHKPYPKTALPRWNGEVVTAGSHLLVIGEQGLGDMLQFARFLPQLSSIFAEVTVLVPIALQNLLAQNMAEHINIVSEISDHQRFSHHIPYMSLAGALRIDAAQITGQPYLRISETPQQLGSQGGGLKIGLAWQGNPQQVDNRWRSLPTHCLAPLLAQHDIHWCNLQYGITPPAGMRDDSGQWQNLADTAAYIKQLDLVISACTSIVHLAGALGVPTLLLSRIDADWRWQARRTDSPWYDSVTIARQSQLGDWDDPIAAALAWVKRQRLQN